MTALSNSEAWINLENHFNETKQLAMRDLFAQDPDRFKKLSLEFEGIFLISPRIA